MTRPVTYITSLLYICIYLLQSCNGNTIDNTKKTSDVLEQKIDRNVIKDTTPSLQSEITCPKCGYKSIETLPTEVCQIKYICKSCNAVLYPKDGDCCVFCTYGDQKCPSKQ